MFSLALKGCFASFLAAHAAGFLVKLLHGGGGLESTGRQDEAVLGLSRQYPALLMVADKINPLPISLYSREG